MATRLRETFRRVCVTLYPAEGGPFWIRPLLHLYALGLMIVAAWEVGRDFVPGKWIIFGIAAASVEVLNQISYHLRTRARLTALAVKAIGFWLVFSLALGIYIVLVRTEFAQTERAVAWVSRFAFVCLMSWISVFYSLSTKFRFLCLYGEFKRRARAA